MGAGFVASRESSLRMGISGSTRPEWMGAAGLKVLVIPHCTGTRMPVSTGTSLLDETWSAIPVVSVSFGVLLCCALFIEFCVCFPAKLNGWKVLSNGGDKFAFEQPPVGCDRVPEVAAGGMANACFATSYHSCSKEQVVTLERNGLTREVLDGCLRPEITCSDW